MGIAGTPRLTTTSYAMLGLLSMRSWTRQELTDQTARGLSRFWPRARSRLEEEPRKLVRDGYAVAGSEQTGDRLREVFTITEPGRAALAAWLGDPAPPAPPALESEHLVRVFLADRGTRTDLLRTLADLEARATAMLTLDAEIAREHLARTAAFSDRTAVTTLTGVLINRQSALLAEWAAECRAVVEGWPEDLSGPLPVDREALEAVVRRAGA